MGIAGSLLYSLIEKIPGGIHAPEVEQRDALIHGSDMQFGIECSGLLKHLQRLFEELLVHVGGAEIVETGSLNGLVSLRWSWSALRSGCEDRHRSQSDAGTNE